ncbi:hypothetical protein BJP40_10740 [Streptomyces sp. CC53]|uniref:DUF4190 domain-containing protein n=1 Tax=unclassified Streptomyces TaxID=2593676 RepID=UPI0008DDB709|nr:MULTISPECIES: DUF4190 domain-containing protein [unclassified Streptomyces]OII60363.1 hypothetical protein BJP40_10740 [Streptomyces sp. CC53]
MSPTSPQDRPAPDHQPYASGPPYPPPATSGLAVASLVTGIVCCVPPLGMVLGVMALRGIRRHGRRGGGMAVAGIVLSALSTLLVAVALTVGLAGGGVPALVDELRGGGDGASVHRLERGTCFDQPGGAAGEQEVAAITEVPCEEPHDAEVTGSFRLDGAAYPGVEPIERQAEQRCGEIADAYALDTWAVPRDAVLFYYHPTVESWRFLGDRTVTCMFAADTGKLTGSLRSDATTLSGDQQAFLTAVNPVDEVWYGEPEADPDADLEANTAWAGRMAKALGASAAALKGHPYRGEAAKPVAELAEQLAAAGESWAAVAAAKDPDTYWERYDTAYGSLPVDFGREARKALNLATVPSGSQGAS